MSKRVFFREAGKAEPKSMAAQTSQAVCFHGNLRLRVPVTPQEIGPF